MNYKRIGLIGLLLCAIAILSTIIINVYIVLSTRDKIIDIIDLDKDIDAVLVLGCKVNGDSPSLMLTKRLEKTIDVYDKFKTKIILSGDSISDDYDEVGVMEDFLSGSINKEDMILDKEGVSTYNSLYRVKNVYNIKKLIIITQEYHIYRALYLADKLDIDAYGVIASDIPQRFVMLKNKIREVFARDKSFFKGMIKPSIGYAIIK